MSPTVPCELRCVWTSFHEVYSVRFRRHFPKKLMVYAYMHVCNSRISMWGSMYMWVTDPKAGWRMTAHVETCVKPAVSCISSMLMVVGYSIGIHFFKVSFIWWKRIRRANDCICKDSGVRGGVEPSRPSEWWPSEKIQTVMTQAIMNKAAKSHAGGAAFHYYKITDVVIYYQLLVRNVFFGLFVSIQRSWTEQK